MIGPKIFWVRESMSMKAIVCDYFRVGFMNVHIFYAHIYTHTYIRTHIYAHIYTHIYINEVRSINTYTDTYLLAKF